MLSRASAIIQGKGEKMNAIVVKKALKENNVFQWELAKKLDISEYTLLRRFRKELSEAEISNYLKAISEITKERK